MSAQPRDPRFAKLDALIAAEEPEDLEHAERT